MAETITGTHCTYPRRDGQAELAWETWISTGMVDPSKVVTDPSTYRVRRSLTSLMWRTLLPQRQTSHIRSIPVNRLAWFQCCRGRRFRVTRARVSLRWPSCAPPPAGHYHWACNCIVQLSCNTIHRSKASLERKPAKRDRSRTIL